MLAYDSTTNKLYDAKKVAFADKIMVMSKLSSMWEVIEEMVKYWEQTNPKQFQSLIIDVTDKRNSRARSSGASKNNSTRYLADIPMKLYNMIKIYYPDSVLEPKFFREFARRFPQYRVSEKI